MYCFINFRHALCIRALSDVQEAAQLLAGAQFPESILDACTRGMSGDMILPSEKLHLLNLTPYDAFLEKVCLKYHLQVAQEARSKPNPQVAVLSCTTDVDTGMYVQQVMGLTTMEDSSQCIFMLLVVPQPSPLHPPSLDPKY